MTTQLDSIEQKLNEIGAKLDKLVKAQSTIALSDAISKAVEQTLKIKAAQEESKPEAPATPKVDKPTAEPGETLPYKEHSKTAKHRPDQTGGAPPVKVGKSDPDSPSHFDGVPQWETGREPRRVEFLTQKVKRRKKT